MATGPSIVVAVSVLMSGVPVSGEQGIQTDIPLAGSGRAGEPTTTAAPARRVLFELRLAEPEPVRGLTFEGKIRDSEQKIYLHYTVLLSNADIRNATVLDNAGRFDVALTLHPEASSKMMTATARHIGRLLAVVLDGELVAVVPVKEPLSGRVVFGANYSAAEARRIAAGLERW